MERLHLERAVPVQCAPLLRSGKPQRHVNITQLLRREIRREILPVLNAVRSDKQLEQADPATLQLISEISQ